MATVRFDGASRVYPGSSHASVDSLSLEIQSGEFIVLVGPTGCGKSTALRMLAGLEEATGGRILIDGVDVTHTTPKERDVAMVFQNYALYPHMSVADNMGFALRIGGVPIEEINQRVIKAAQILGLADQLDARPQELSGGQRQRVAMARAIVREPRVFIMDEPLINLEPQLRDQTRDQIATLQRQLGITTLYATTDQLEAVSIGDRVAVLNHGVLQQCADPQTLYDHPANVFVAGYIGTPMMNIFPAPVHEDSARVGELDIALPADVAQRAGDSIIIGVRPQDLTVTSDPSQPGLTVLVETIDSEGEDTYVYATPNAVVPAPAEALDVVLSEVADALPGDESDVMLVASVPAGAHVREGEPARVHIDPAKVHLFHARTGERLTS